MCKIECIDIFEEEEKEKNEKNCPICGRIQSYTTKSGLNGAIKNETKCKICKNHYYKKKKISVEVEIKKNKKNKKRRERYKKNPKYQSSEYKEKRRIYASEYVKKPENQKKIREHNKRYKEKPENRKKIREYSRKRRKNPMVKLSHNISGCMLYTLKTNNLNKKRKHWEDLIINTKEEIIEHLEKHFLPGMSWKNYGKKWEIDHIIPVRFFKFTNTDDIEFKYLWSLDNLQPMWKKNNKEKSDKMMLWGKEVRARNLYKKKTTELKTIPDINI